MFHLLPASHTPPTPTTPHTTADRRYLTLPRPPTAWLFSTPPRAPKPLDCICFTSHSVYLSPHLLRGKRKNASFCRKPARFSNVLPNSKTFAFPVRKQTDALPDGAAPKKPFPLSYTYARSARRDFLFTARATAQHTLSTVFRAAKPNTAALFTH